MPRSRKWNSIQFKFQQMHVQIRDQNLVGKFQSVHRLEKRNWGTWDSKKSFLMIWELSSSIWTTVRWNCFGLLFYGHTDIKRSQGERFEFRTRKKCLGERLWEGASFCLCASFSQWWIGNIAKWIPKQICLTYRHVGHRGQRT